MLANWLAKLYTNLDSKNTVCSLYTCTFIIDLLSDILTKLLTKLADFLAISLVQLNQ
ncbi:hypothetical protein CU005_2461 [Enterococcus faecium]|nr:hypothetical protein [Enterococcus faecium]